jgi:hypothetical protein
MSAHAIHKSKVDNAHLYVKDNNKKAFLEPTLENASLPGQQVALLLSQTFSKDK